MRVIAALLVCALAGAATTAAAQNVTRYGRAGAMIHESVEVGPGAKYLYIGGQAASLLDANDKAKGYGDTKTQVVSTLGKMKAVLERHGYTMNDMIKMNIWVAADPAMGKADYEGMNAGFKEFFGTTANPNTVVRTALEVKALQSPALFVEIEGVAAH
jgi:2-iminobutanoate/2-iminopropanoate deaminase